MIFLDKTKLYRLRRATTLSVATLLVPATVVLASCGVSSNEEIQEDRANVTTDDLSGDLSTAGTGIEDAENLIGESVTVRSSIQESISDGGFTLETDDGENILVLNDSLESLSVPDEEIPVQVTGEVARFAIAEIESEYGIDLDENLYTDYEGRPTIIASSIALAPTPEQIAEYADAFGEQVIATQGDLRDIYSSDAAAVFSEGWIDDVGILIVGFEDKLQGESDPFQEGENVAVTGRLEPFDASRLSQEYDLGFTDEQLNEFSQRYNRPVLVVEEIYSSAVEK